MNQTRGGNGTRHFLNGTFPFINASRLRNEAIGRCDELCKALNKTWTAFFHTGAAQDY